MIVTKAVTKVIVPILKILLLELLLEAIVFGIPTMLLWNFLMPDLLGLKQINFFQAAAMIILSEFVISLGKNFKEAMKAVIDEIAA